VSAITSYLLAAVAAAEGDPDVVCANEAAKDLELARTESYGEDRE